MRYCLIACLSFMILGCIHTSPKYPVRYQNTETGLYGYKTRGGEIVVRPRYHLAEEFNSHGIAAVADESGWKYIDISGQEIIRPFIYDNGPDYFQEGLARYVHKGKVGFMDKNGRIAVKAEFDFALPFSQGYAPVCFKCRPIHDREHISHRGGKWGYIDKSGTMVIPAIYDGAEPFDQGKARVVLKGKDFFISKPASDPYITGNYHLSIIYGPEDKFVLPLPRLPHKTMMATLDLQKPFIRQDGIYCSNDGRYMEGLCRFADKKGCRWTLKFSAESLRQEKRSVLSLLIIQDRKVFLQTDFVFRGRACDILNLGVPPFNIIGLPLNNNHRFSISLDVGD